MSGLAVVDRLIPAQATSRGHVFAWVCILGFANGSIGRVTRAIADVGLLNACLDTFGISAIVFAAFGACIALLRRAPPRHPGRADMVAAGLATLLILLPAGPLSWVGLTGLGIYMILGEHRSARAEPRRLPGARPMTETHRAAWILLATTGAAFWGTRLLQLASTPILRADASLVAMVFGLDHVDNTVSFADGEGFVWIAPECSSLHNLSLAVLCWVVMVQYKNRRPRLSRYGWLVAACVAVVAINVVRVGLMTQFHESFDLIHGPAGGAIAGSTSLVIILACCLAGTRPGRIASV